jgi:hypothetical protein
VIAELDVALAAGEATREVSDERMTVKGPRSIGAVRRRLTLAAEASLDRFDAHYAVRRGEGFAPGEAMRLAAADTAAEIRNRRLVGAA